MSLTVHPILWCLTSRLMLRMLQTIGTGHCGHGEQHSDIYWVSSEASAYSFNALLALLIPSRRLRARRLGGDRSGTVGAPHLAACEGKVFWELRIVSAQGVAFIGFAGTSFRCGSQAPQDMHVILGMDEAAWALDVDSGRTFHGSFHIPDDSGSDADASDVGPGGVMVAGFLREGATACVAWDCSSGSILVSVDGAPYVSLFPPDAPVRPSAAAGAAMYPAICGFYGCVVEYSMQGGLGLVPPSPEYVPCSQVPTFPQRSCLPDGRKFVLAFAPHLLSRPQRSACCSLPAFQFRRPA
jgi:hypothetical protein